MSLIDKQFAAALLKIVRSNTETIRVLIREVKSLRKRVELLELNAK